MKVVSMRGQVLDVGRYIAQNENAVALGNAKMNARGDLIGPGGKIVRRREQITQDYHKASPTKVKQVSLRDISADVFKSPSEALAATTPAKPQAPAKASRRKITDSDE
jgi:hypothetical protein